MRGRLQIEWKCEGRVEEFVRSVYWDCSSEMIMTLLLSIKWICFNRILFPGLIPSDAVDNVKYSQGMRVVASAWKCEIYVIETGRFE